ncbi:MAG: GMC family oxidoreductase [Geminicoccaceae bacterium]|nr:GMC family oxidoreductase [Geminicoccaceae bacterium]MCB9944923.1 GMC family oxidoreductase [Geminicoccaceae bacterium]
MFEFARRLTDQSRHTVDVCIVGGGAAGISMALQFIGKETSVLLAEAGGENYDNDIQSLYRSQAIGLHIDTETARLRQFGGSTHHWGGRSRPLTAHEFGRRDWIPMSGWPIPREALMKHIPRAMEICEIRLDGLDHWSDPIDKPDIWPLESSFRPGLWRFSPPTAFGSRYWSDFEAASNVEVLLEAALVDMRLEGDRVSTLHFRSPDGKHVTVEARLVVLACGGIENARLLLASNSQRPAGIGNEHDLVGRYFAGHPVYESLQVQLAYNARLPFFLDDWTTPEGDELEGMLSLRDEQQERLQTTSIDGAFYPGGQFGPPGIRAMRRIYQAARRGKLPQDLSGDIAAIAGDIGGIADEVMERAGWRTARGASYTLSVLVEQVPNPDSRVTLLPEKDALGLPVAQIDWRLSEMDRHSVRTFSRLLANEIGRMQLGRAQLEDWIADDSEPFPPHGNSSHHIGTTRMNPDPGLGVVDNDCRVHGIDNLYIAGSSVFPIGGVAHPTLNLIALALRLADHLGERLRNLHGSARRKNEDGKYELTTVP